MIQVTIVCASPLLAQGLHAAIAAEPGLAIEIVDSLERRLPQAPELVIAPVADARAALAVYDAFARQARLILIGSDLRAVYAHQAPRGEPIALLAADASGAQVRIAVAAVISGLSVCDPQHAPEGFAALPKPYTDCEPLTPRELEVYELLAKGLSNRDIGAALEISAHTAKFHVAQILAKVGAATRAQAVLIGMQMGLIGA